MIVWIVGGRDGKDVRRGVAAVTRMRAGGILAANAGPMIRELDRFPGPNLHLPHPCILAALDGRAVAGAATVPPRAAAALRTLLLDAVRANRRLLPSSRNDAILNSGVPQSPAVLVALTCCELQRLNGEGAGGWRILEEPAQDPAIIAFGYETLKVGRAAMAAACDLVAAAAAAREGAPDLPASVAAFLEMARRQSLGITLRRVLNAAEQRGIPWQRVNEGEPLDQLVELGEGCHRQRLFGATSSRTPMMGAMIADSKRLSAQMLRRIGLPAPRNALAHSIEQAQRIAGRLGYPVVVKPESGANATGVTVGVTDRDALRRAFEAAAEQGRVLIEEFVPGDDHRMLVIGGRLVATALREPAQIVGDGVSTIARCIAEANRDPDRGTKFLNTRATIEIDDAVEALLRASGRSLQSVPAAGEIVKLRRTANISTGGTARDVSAHVHPDNRWMAETVAAMSGLDIVGVDFLTPDISRPYSAIRCGINEINTKPGFGPHFGKPGEHPDVVAILLDHIAPPGATLTIPTVAVCGRQDTAPLATAIGEALSRAGLHAVVASSAGIVSGGRLLNGTPMLGASRAGGAVLSNPDAQAGVMTMTPQRIARRGLGWNRNDVAVLVGPAGDPDDAAAMKLLASTTRKGLVVMAEAMPGLLASGVLEAAPATLVVCSDAAACATHRAAGYPSVSPGPEGMALLQPVGRAWPLAAGEHGLVAAAVALVLALPTGRGEAP